MIFKAQNQTYTVPTNWGMVKYKDFAAWHTEGLPLSKKLSYQTTIPEEIITNLPVGDLVQVLNVVQFQDTLPEMYDDVGLMIEIGNKAYIKFELARRELENQNQWAAAIEIVKLYTGRDISELSVIEAYGYAVFFLNRLKGSSQSTKG